MINPQILYGVKLDRCGETLINDDLGTAEEEHRCFDHLLRRVQGWSAVRPGGNLSNAVENCKQ